MKKFIISLFAAGLLASAASAQLYIVQGDTGVKAEFTFTIDDSANTVTVFIDNTIAGVGGAFGRITGFGFNVPFSGVQLGVNGANVSFTEDADSDWNKFVPFAVEPSDPFEQDFGVGTGETANGGGDGGIQYGSTATFVFTFPDFGAGADWLGEDALTVRFQSVTDWQGATGQSDKVLGNPDDGPDPSGFVPEPSTYGMFGALALLSMMVVRQLRRR
ncbi:MAG TPA: PEP-CTERM sorting domain-containing protein [Opitutaceae bacterium]